MSQIMLWPHIAMTTSVTTMKIFIEIIFEGDKIVFKRSYDTLTESYTLDHFIWNSLNWLKACLMNFIWNDPLWIFFLKKVMFPNAYIMFNIVHKMNLIQVTYENWCHRPPPPKKKKHFKNISCLNDRYALIQNWTRQLIFKALSVR